MNELLIHYDTLDSSELHGQTTADYFVSLQATLRVWDGEMLVYVEPAFPVVELAWSLRRWIEGSHRGDFVFESMSFEEVGSVEIRRGACGWVASSVFAPTSASSPHEWAAVRRSVGSFISRIERDLIAIGVDPAEIDS